MDHHFPQGEPGLSGCPWLWPAPPAPPGPPGPGSDAWAVAPSAAGDGFRKKKTKIGKHGKKMEHVGKKLRNSRNVGKK